MYYAFTEMYTIWATDDTEHNHNLCKDASWRIHDRIVHIPIWDCDTQGSFNFKNKWGKVYGVNSNVT